MNKRANLSNDISVRALKWKTGDPKQFRVRDVDRLGLYIRVTKHGKKTWEYRYPVRKGKYRYLAFGHFPKLGCADALAKYENHREQVKDYGVDPKKHIAGTILTLTDLFNNHYIPRYAKKKKKTWHEDVDLYRLHVEDLIGTTMADAVSANDIEEALGRLEQAGKLHTMRKTHAVLNKIFNWATSRASAQQPGSGPLLLSQNPCKDVELPSMPQSNKRMLSQVEIRKIWNHAKQDICVDRIIKLLILTGCRISEITELHTDEIDWGAGDIVLQPDRTKNNRLHVVPLTTRMKHIIGPNINGYLFPARSELGHTTTSGVRIALSKYCKKLAIPHISPNDFRDTFISHTARIGIIREHRDRLTNHADPSVDGKNYNAYEYYQEKVDGLLKWDAEITRILNEGN